MKKKTVSVNNEVVCSKGARTVSHRLVSHCTVSHTHLHTHTVSHTGNFTFRQFHIQRVYHKDSVTKDTITLAVFIPK